MNINWAGAKAKMQSLISATGTWIQFLNKVVSGSDAYDTSSSISSGYGDQTTYWVTGSIQAIISHVSAEDVVLEIGYYAEDYEKIYVDPDVQGFDQWDQVIIPSGSGVRYLVLPLHKYYMGVNGVNISTYAVVRRLFPRSGSQN